MRLANVELVLAAMDTIIDKDEGKVLPERAQAIEDAIRTIRDGIETARATGEVIGQPDLMATFEADLATVAKAIQVDLKTMIEANAPTEEFSKLNDAIDGGGENMIGALSTLSEQGKVVLSETIVSENSTASMARFAQIGTALLAILLIAPAMLFVVRSITSPLTRLRENMVQLADGELEIDIVDADRKDEIGHMARAVEVFRDNAREQSRLSVASEAEQLQKAQRQERIDSLIASFRTNVLERLSTVGANTEKMEETAAALTEVANATNQQASDASAASQQASSNVQTVAAAAEELAASISEIERQVEQTTAIVGEATGSAQETNEKVASLANAAQKIGDVVSLIQAIAEQTNLLALNATIEAARAGDAGKGFAVVAAEVKELATQTSKATEEISQQISAIQGSTDQAVEAIGVIAEKIESVNAFTTTIAAAVRQQGDATGEISENVNQAAVGTQHATDNIAGVTEAASRATASAEDVRHVSSDMAVQAQALEDAISAFLDDVAAA
ncbi:methyl-accepting chemotaxis protein [Roseibium aggregatum]|uniref:HAMP domain-containing protein n=1 Tax=Roseibium aggregatum TaxID=187304 RepID=A0A926S9Z9_9HYPH|nr:HAMP domain-containing methyl-accepting chemotaxis protein [Roseibium aggregatum]MBD1547914.1 HAMP domain-containing protein [Roseibium aggregatum]